MTLNLNNGDCLEIMKTIPDKSIDVIFCDLPYGQTSCKWDCCIDLDLFWKQVMRIKKTNTPILMTTTTKFGVSLIQSAPKKCPFRYDLVWCKSAPCGFLSAKKMPMRKHEMIYVFYEKLPFYDLSSHKHKFVKTAPRKKNNLYGMKAHADGKEGKYEPPLPNSLIKEDNCNTAYGNNTHYSYLQQKNGESIYEPPLPHSLLEIKSTRGKHSTEKPVALMEWLFKYYSKEGDTILDPTMGSGSTGVACKNMNRNFIGIEMDKDIYEIAEKRLLED
jgi:DNA modification methylase